VIVSMDFVTDYGVESKVRRPPVVAIDGNPYM
jgi:hypothetical protein